MASPTGDDRVKVTLDTGASRAMSPTARPLGQYVMGVPSVPTNDSRVFMVSGSYRPASENVPEDSPVSAVFHPLPRTVVSAVSTSTLMAALLRNGLMSP